MGIKVEIDDRGLVQSKTEDGTPSQLLVYGTPVVSGSHAAPSTLTTMRTESLTPVGGAGISFSGGAVSVRAKRTSPSGMLAPNDPVDVWFATLISATGDIPLSFTLPSITGWPINGTAFCLAVVMNPSSPNTTFPALWTVSATGGGASLSFTPGLVPGVGNWTCGGSGGFLAEFHFLYYTAT